MEQQHQQQYIRLQKKRNVNSFRAAILKAIFQFEKKKYSSGAAALKKMYYLGENFDSNRAVIFNKIYPSERKNVDIS